MWCFMVHKWFIKHLVNKFKYVDREISINKCKVDFLSPNKLHVIFHALKDFSSPPEVAGVYTLFN